MYPWLWLTWVYRLPWSGDVSQDIEPRTIWDLPFSGPYQGDGPLERRILADGAGYGQQLDAIHEALKKLLPTADELAERLQEPISKQEKETLEAYQKLRNLQDSVERVKARYRADKARQARQALDSLQESAPDDYAALVESRARELAKTLPAR